MLKPITLNRETKKIMPTYVIENEMLGVGRLSGTELRAAAQHSVSVLNEMGPSIQWVRSYVTADKIYAIYAAPDEEAVLAYVRQVGLSANRVSEVATIIDPTTAEPKGDARSGHSHTPR